LEIESENPPTRRLAVGVIGHVDHGKTALVRALTGEDTDRLPEEKRRGISIALGFAHLKVGLQTQIDLIDMPGHERFVRTMISGATGIDAVLLVVAANEGLKPQTLEHVNIAGLLGLRRAVVAISKTDLVAPEAAQRVAEDAVRLLAKAGIEALPPVMSSVARGPDSKRDLQDTGIGDLRQRLQALAENLPPRTSDGSTYLPIDRAFSIAGHGPVVTGTLRGATVRTGDTLELLPLRRRVRVRALQVHKAFASAAMPGQRVAVNLRDIEIAELKRGMTLVEPDTLAPSGWLTLSICAVDGGPPLKSGIKLHALLGTDELDVHLRLLDRDVLEGGETGFAQLRCLKPVAIPAGEHVILRLDAIADGTRTVAGGKILECGNRRQPRNCSRTLKRLEDLRMLPPAELIAAEVRREGPAGSTLRRLSQLTALSVPRVTELLKAQPFRVTQSGLVIGESDMDDLLSRVPPLVAAHPSGLSQERLLSALAGTSAAVLGEVLERLLARGAINRRGSQLFVPRPEEDRLRATKQAERVNQIAETLRRGGLTPPNPGAIVTDVQSKRAVDHLLREGIVIRAVDRAKGREILFHRDAIKDAQLRLAPILERAPGLLVTEIGAALGISRKYSMPLLDHLDRVRFTRRVEDRRIRGEGCGR
jgi:selenocysteine-specific elongation factor